eukprot:scaffold154_cov373-Prasinococcus_capsulatus_cf.AAC.2
MGAPYEVFLSRVGVHRLQLPPVPPTAKSMSLEMQVMRALITQGCILRVDRVMQKPPPGHKKLPKWPKRVMLTREQGFVEKIPREAGMKTPWSGFAWPLPYTDESSMLGVQPRMDKMTRSTFTPSRRRRMRTACL